MANSDLYYRLRLAADGRYVDVGSLSVPVTTASIGTPKVDQTFSIATATVTAILNIGAGATDDLPAAGFALCVIVSSVKGWVELQGASAADNSIIPIAANVPLIIGPSVADASLGGGLKTYSASGQFTNTASAVSIVKINYLQKTGSAATVRVVAF